MGVTMKEQTRYFIGTKKQLLEALDEISLTEINTGSQRELQKNFGKRYVQKFKVSR